MANYNYDYSFDIVDRTNTIYKKAFDARFFYLWNATPCRLQIEQLEYFRAMNIFLQENIDTEHDRRKLLYYYCEPYMATAEYDDTLNQLISVLPTNNLYVKKVMRAICNLYDNPPVRTFETAKSELFEDLIKDSNINVMLSEAHKLAKLSSRCLVRPEFINGVLNYNIVTSEYYAYCVRDGVEELWIHRVLEENNKYYDCFHVWTKDTFRVYDTDLKNITERYLLSISTAEQKMPITDTVKNVYGKIPYLELRLNDVSNGANNGLWELIRAQLDYNRLSILDTNNVVYNGFSMMSFINFGLAKSGLKLGAGAVINIDDVAEDSGLLPPTFENLTPSSEYNEIAEFKQNNINNTLRLYDLPNSMIEASANLQSGVAMQIDRIGLLEYRREDENALRNFDRELMQFTADIYNVAVKPVFTSPINASIDFVEDNYPTDPQLDYDLATTKFNSGLIDLYTYMSIVTGYDNITNNEEAFELIKNNIYMLNKIKELGNGQTRTNAGTIDANADNGYFDRASDTNADSGTE